jgi:CheY-like chemotaxis protein
MAGKTKPNRILIVEDEGIVASDIAKCLENFGYEVSAIAASAEDALQAAASTNPDLVLMDITIEGPVDAIYGGLEVLRRFRGTDSLEQIPVVIVTSSDSAEDRADAARLGANYYFRKPTDYDQFLKVGDIIRDFLSAGTDWRNIAATAK